MPLIGKPNPKEPLNPMANTNVPSMELPSFRYLLSQERRTTKNVLIKTPYALGDCVCAEPSIRFAARYFLGCSVSVVTPFPDLYRHIPLTKIYNLKKDEKPEWDDYYVLECYHPADALQSEFVHNFNMAIGDYIAVCLFKGMLPVKDRHIQLMPSAIERMPPQKVVIHAGKHWPSKTFPQHWWDALISCFLSKGIVPTLVGAKVDGGKRGYVDVDASECQDWRDKLTVMQSASALQNAQVVITNDSAPLHIAASGNAWIGYLSTVRHPDFVTHWRPTFDGSNQWGHKMRDFALGRMWQESDTCPIKNGSKYDVIDYHSLMDWLPDPMDVVEWAKSRIIVENFESKVTTINFEAKS